MIRKTVDIYVPLMNGEEYSDHFGSFDKVLKELIQLSGQLELKFQNKVISTFLIVKMTKRKKEIREISKDQYKNKYLSIFIKFSTELKIKDNNDYENTKEFYYSFEYFAESYIRHFLIYINLAKPGAFDTREGYIKIEEVVDEPKIEIRKFHMLANQIPYALELCKRYKWPPIKELSIKQTLMWLDQHWTAFETISNNRIQRALNAFSYLFHDTMGEDAPNDLFNAMLGVEALFVQGNSNIQEQVNLKSQILLGNRKEFKKVFSDLYDYRSRYIHGQLNFINKYFVDDLFYEKAFQTSEKSQFAIMILISAIQKHIEDDKLEYEFELILKE